VSNSFQKVTFHCVSFLLLFSLYAGMKTDDRWSWNDPLDIAVITTEEIITKRLPVLRVRHESGHGGWQFYDNTEISGQEPIVLTKTEILSLDKSLINVANLEVGWEAERKDHHSPWLKHPIL
jgi:hypothetical protein